MPLGRRPTALIEGAELSVFPLPMVLTVTVPNPMITGGVGPAVVATPAVGTMTVPSPVLTRGHVALVDLLEGSTVRASYTQVLTDTFAPYGFDVDAGTVAAFSAWDDVRVRVTVDGDSGRTAVSQVELELAVTSAVQNVTVTAAVLTATIPNPQLTAGGSPPDAVIGSPASPEFTAAAGQLITFDPIGTSDPESGWGGTWRFGDGDEFTGTFGDYASHVVQHAYAAAGDYTVEWDVVDDVGNHDIATTTAHITAAAPVATTLTVSPSSFGVFAGSPGTTRALTATVLDQFGNTMSGQIVGWVSSNTARATVSPATGSSTTVTGQSQTGSVTITASTPPGGAVQGTSACTVSTQPASNEPAGFTQFLSDDFSGDPSLSGERTPFERQTGMTIGARSVSNWPTSGTSNLERVQPGDAQSAPYVWRVRLPQSSSLNVIEPHWDYWREGSNPSSNRMAVEELYVRYWIRLVNSYGDNQWLNHSQLTKTWYFAHGNTASTNGSFHTIRGRWNDGTRAPDYITSFKMMLMVKHYRLDSVDGELGSGGGAIDLSQLSSPLADPSSPIGSWAKIEMYCKANSLVSDSQDGIVRIWHNGVLKYDYRQWRSRSLKYPLGFYRLHFATVFGGQTWNHDRAEWFDYDDVYASYA